MKLFRQESLILLALLMTSCGGLHESTAADAALKTADPFDMLVTSFLAAHERLAVPPLELSFVANLKQLGTAEELRDQMTQYTRLSNEIGRLDAAELEPCRQIDLAIMQIETEMGLRRAELGLRFKATETDVTGVQRLSDVALGAEWYAYYLDRWNGADLEPGQTFEFGEEQLARSVERYDALQKQMGFAGDDAALARHLASSAAYLDDQGAARLFAERQERVWQGLAALFPNAFGVEPANIARSDRGADFAVPGYYSATEQTFYYNVLEERGYEARQADWLFLHEATPGHHFQITATRERRRCVTRLSEFSYSAFVEGWAAYTETLGKDLGLYQSLEAELAAVEWDMVRSVRVILDVGLNAWGWSDAKALAYWHDNVRGQRDVARREIDRMKRWPGQVVTYKYGESVFLRSKAALMRNERDAERVRRFHDAAIGYGSMPLATFEALLPVLTGVPIHQ